MNALCTYLEMRKAYKTNVTNASTVGHTSVIQCANKQGKGLGER